MFRSVIVNDEYDYHMDEITTGLEEWEDELEDVMQDYYLPECDISDDEKIWLLKKYKHFRQRYGREPGTTIVWEDFYKDMKGVISH